MGIFGFFHFKWLPLKKYSYPLLFNVFSKLRWTLCPEQVHRSSVISCFLSYLGQDWRITLRTREISLPYRYKCIGKLPKWSFPE